MDADKPGAAQPQQYITQMNSGFLGFMLGIGGSGLGSVHGAPWWVALIPVIILAVCWWLARRD